MSPKVFYETVKERLVTWWRKGSEERRAKRGGKPAPVKAKAPPPPPPKPEPTPEPEAPVARKYEPPPPTPTPALDELVLAKAAYDLQIEKDANVEAKREARARQKAINKQHRDRQNAKAQPEIDRRNAEWPKQEEERKKREKAAADRAAENDRILREVDEWLKAQKVGR